MKKSMWVGTLGQSQSHAYVHVEININNTSTLDVFQHLNTYFCGFVSAMSVFLRGFCLRRVILRRVYPLEQIILGRACYWPRDVILGRAYLLQQEFHVCVDVLIIPCALLHVFQQTVRS
jgi:hypothetical protein